jgi:uncharacterized glyoxalase superfamily protein PhnB
MRDPLRQLRPDDSTEQPGDDFADRLRTRVASIEARSDRRRAGWHLAQLNLGLFRAPLDAPEMAPFANALDRINALAEASPGFVWRLTDADGGPSSNVEVPGADDPLVASNLSVWTDMESLRGFMYRTDHASYLRRRREWFQHEDQAMNVLWWTPAGTVPTLAEAVERLEHLRRHGPSHTGWPLARTVPPPPGPAHGPDRHRPRAADAVVGAALGAVVNAGADRDDRGSGVIPYLTVGNARAAIDFYREVFEAEPRGDRVEMPDGRIGHAELLVAGDVVYLADEFPESDLLEPQRRGGTTVSLVVSVDDCDAVYAHAVAAGATGQSPPSDRHGQRGAWLVDPWGHRWHPVSPIDDPGNDKGDRSPSISG